MVRPFYDVPRVGQLLRTVLMQYSLCQFINNAIRAQWRHFDKACTTSTLRWQCGVARPEHVWRSREKAYPNFC